MAVSPEADYVVFDASMDNLTDSPVKVTFPAAVLNVFLWERKTEKTVCVSARAINGVWTASSGGGNGHQHGGSAHPWIAVDDVGGGKRIRVVYETESLGHFSEKTDQITDIALWEVTVPPNKSVTDVYQSSTLRLINQVMDGLKPVLDGNGKEVRGNKESRHACISKNGRYVVFNTEANNYLGFTDGRGKPVRDFNELRDDFRKDLETGALVPVSADSTGYQGLNDLPGFTREPHQPYGFWTCISADGRYVSFVSIAAFITLANVDAGPFFAQRPEVSFNIFRKDMMTQNLELVTFAGRDRTKALFKDCYQGNAASMSEDGSRITFSSNDPSITSENWGTSRSQVYVRDMNQQYNQGADYGLILASAQLEKPTVPTTGNCDLAIPSISLNGRYVSFMSNARDLVREHKGKSMSDPLLRQLFVRDLDRNVTYCGGLSSYDEEVDVARGATAWEAVLSGDGRDIVFIALGDPRMDRSVPITGPNSRHFYLKNGYFDSASHYVDIFGGQSGRDIGLNGLPGHRNSPSTLDNSPYLAHAAEDVGAHVDSTGRYVVFASNTQLDGRVDYPISRDSDPGETQVYLYDRVARDVICISVVNPGLAGRRQAASGKSWQPVIATVGKYSPVGGKREWLENHGRNPEIAMEAPLLLEAEPTQGYRTIQVAFTTKASSIITQGADWGRGTSQVVLWTGTTTYRGKIVENGSAIQGTIAYVSADENGNPAKDGVSDSPAIAADGDFVAFRSDSAQLWMGMNGERDDDGTSTVYMKEMQAGARGRVTPVSVLGRNFRDAQNKNVDTNGKLYAGQFVRNGYAAEPTVSRDGRYVAFSGNGDFVAPPQAPPNPNAPSAQQIYVKDLGANPTDPMGALETEVVNDIETARFRN
ncbi:MAG: hypothetical protein HYX75_03680 [Acidobacteria bacterium]|nr:hypothetical protein [Acidobacteriota bacterium]